MTLQPIAREVTTGKGSVFIQPGPNEDVEYLGCVGLEGLSESHGSSEPQFCIGPGGRYIEKATLSSPPSRIGYSLREGLSADARSVIQQYQQWGDPFTIYIVHSIDGKPDQLMQFGRAHILENAKIEQSDFGNMAAFDTDERIVPTYSVTARPPSIIFNRIRPNNTTTYNVMAANGTFYSLASATSGQFKGRKGRIYAVINDGSQAGKVAYLDRGNTWLPTQSRPFALTSAGRTARLIVALDSGRLVAIWTPVAINQYGFSYSDDGGFSWVDIVSGSAPTTAATNWSVDAWGNTVIVGCSAGYIYRTEDGGATWRAVEAGATTTNTFTGIQFLNEEEAFAVASDALMYSYDNGASWTEIAGPSGESTMRSVAATSTHLWVTGSKVWYRAHNESDWHERVLPYTYASPYTQIRFYNDYVAAILQTGGTGSGNVNRLYYTVTGGAANTWSYYDLGVGANGLGLIPSATLNDLQWFDQNTLYVAGDNARAFKLA